MKIPINEICLFIKEMCLKNKIDESHGTKHALDVFRFSSEIVKNEIKNYPYLNDQQNIIYTSALLHDTCDKKYVDENEGIKDIKNFLQLSKYKDDQIEIIINIIKTMSYSKVKKFGFPKLNNFQMAYHIVREADLLAAYDFDRTLLFGINHNELNYKDSFIKSEKLYLERMAKHHHDGLLITDTSKLIANSLLTDNLNHIALLKKIL